MRKNKLLSLIMRFVMIVSMLPSAAFARTSDAVYKNDYYYNQLATSQSKAIYNALNDMYKEGKLESGNYTMDLIARGKIENKRHRQNVLMADFINAKDAFMLDNNVFYVDFDKLSLTYSEEGGSYSAKIGIGRYDTYFYDGFDSTNTAGAIQAFEEKVNSIAAAANNRDTLKNKIKTAYDMVMATTEYALEKDAEPENVFYVRTPYGALVKGQSVCEGYARAMKAVLDKMEIDNVLVVGYYSEGRFEGPHIWNYVKMDDNRWYLVDATMEDGESGGLPGEKYLLLHSGTNRQSPVNYYYPNGVISLSALSFEFTYPELSVAPYAEMSDKFKLTVKEDGARYISYNGMGINRAHDNGEYIVCSFDGINWYYLRNYTIFAATVMGATPGDVLASSDSPTEFNELFKMCYYGVTSIEPPHKDIPTTEENLPRETEIIKTKEYYGYYGGIDNISHISKTGELTEMTEAPPAVASKSPQGSIVKPGRSYDVTVVYTESLIKANEGQPVRVINTNPVAGSSISNFKWDGDKTINFTFTTSESFGYIINYYFAVENLIGKSSRQSPAGVGFSSVQAPKYDCPKVSWDINEIHSNIPALISDSNLAENNWLDKNNQPVGENLPSRLALVATTPSAAQTEAMLNSIKEETGKTPISSQTFEISLTLCSGRVSYITGNKVKVFVPYTEGYSEKSGTVFKAYHFKNGIPQEIDCVAVKNGIVMLCDSFSPFAIVQLEDENKTKTVMTVAGGGGSFDTEFVKLDENQNKTFKLTAKDGFVIQKLTLNGKDINLKNGTSDEVELKYSDIQQENILEAVFVRRTVSEGIPQPTAAPSVSPEATAGPVATKEPVQQPQPTSPVAVTPKPTYTPVATPEADATQEPEHTSSSTPKATPRVTDIQPTQSPRTENDGGNFKFIVPAAICTVLVAAIIIYYACIKKRGE